MKVSIIGAGAMGGSIARGLLDARQKGQLDGSTVIAVSNPSTGKLQPLAEAGAEVATSNLDILQGSDIVILCVKPWYIENVIHEIKDAIDYSHTEIAMVVAGINLAALSKWLAKAGDPTLPPHCISMPNTAVATRQSMTFQVDGPTSCPLSLSLFSLLGTVMTIEERLLPAATSLASCGIAYAMRYVRAAMEGGVQLGFKASVAQKVLIQTLLGAASLLSLPGVHPETEIDKVTTPGGLTIKGLNAMEHSGFTSSVINGLLASTPSQN